jgi:hypothetical protein
MEGVEYAAEKEGQASVTITESTCATGIISEYTTHYFPDVSARPQDRDSTDMKHDRFAFVAKIPSDNISITFGNDFSDTFERL